MPPTIVLVPGAWSTPAMYSPLLKALGMEGFKTEAVTLPTTNNAKPPTATYTDDVVHLRRILEDIAERGEKIILVMHSYGGLVGSDACKGILATDISSGAGVCHLVYLGAYMVPSGWGVVRVVNALNKQEYAATGMDAAEDGTTRLTNPEAHYFEGLSDAQVRTQLSGLVEWHPTSSLVAETSYAPWSGCDTTFVKTSRDIMMPPEYQSLMLDLAAEHIASGNVQVQELQTGHCPFVEDVGGCVNIIKNAG